MWLGWRIQSPKPPRVTLRTPPSSAAPPSDGTNGHQQPPALGVPSVLLSCPFPTAAAAFQAQPESPGSKCGLGKPDAISSVRTQVPPDRGDGHPVPCLGNALGSRETFEHSNQEIPSAEELKQGLLFPKNFFLPHAPRAPGVPLTVSCPGDAGSLWMLPWKGPQEKPSGRLLRLRTRLCPSCTSRASSSAGRHAQRQRDEPQNLPLACSTPNPAGCGCHDVPREGGSIPSLPGGPGTARGVRTRPGAEEGAFPIPSPKVAAASGLNGFDYLIRLWFNGLDNM